MKRNRILSLILAMLLTVTAVSCTEEAVESVDGTITETIESATETEAAENQMWEYIDDEIPEYDFEGAEVAILSTDYYGAMLIEEQTGDVLKDAQFNSIAAIEERFNVDISETLTSDCWSEEQIGKVVKTGDNTYTFANMIDRYAMNSAINEYILAIDSLPCVNLDRIYWGGMLTKNISIGGKTFFGFGDYEMQALAGSAVLFNKNIHADLGLENIYSLVLDGSWYFDKFSEMCVAATMDLDGNGAMDENDRYGFDMYYFGEDNLGWTAWTFLWAAGETSIAMDEENIPYFALIGNERAIDVLNAIYDLTYTDKALHGYIDYPKAFKNRQGLFCVGNINAASYRDMEDDFGIIPYPKFDETQENYWSKAGGGQLMVVPITAPDSEMAGVILEALASTYHNTVVPEYYETCLKVKYVRDDESAEMVSLIYENRIYDFGYSFLSAIIETPLANEWNANGAQKFASFTAKYEKQVKMEIKKMVKAFK